jgi:hypothetical protein
MHFTNKRRSRGTQMKVKGCRFRFYLYSFVCLVLLFFCFSPLTFASTTPAQAADTQWQQGIVQIIAYNGENLFNQGSGVVVSEGTILTSAHLLKDADNIYVLDQAGHRKSAVKHYQDESRDIAILQSQIALKPVKFAIDKPTTGETVAIGGYWRLSEEEADSSFFRLNKKPNFTAEIIAKAQFAKALVTEADSGQNHLKMVTTVGRGAYGAPVINRCGEIVGLVRPSMDKSIDELWQPHMPVGAIANDIISLGGLLSANHISVLKADKICLSQAEEIEQAEKKSAQEKLEEQKIKLKKEKEKVKKAQNEARKAKEATGNAKKAKAETEKQLNEVSEIASNAGKKIEDISSEVKSKEKRNEFLTMAIASSIVLALIIILLLVLKRRMDLSKAKDALAAASAVFGDLRFEGVGSAGAPLAFYVLGREIMQRDNGLLIGRNPDCVQVVIADETVSREHARLLVESDHLYVQDLGSTTGTRVNGSEVGDKKFGLISDDIVEFGGVRLKLNIIKG